MKLNIIEERGTTPAVTVVPTVWIPFAPRQVLRAGALLFWGWELPLGFELEMNAGIIAAPQHAPELVLASAVTHKVVGRLSAFIDIYATGFDVQLGTGVLLPIGRDVQIDAGTYIGITGAVYVASPFVGFSLRR